MCVRNLFIVIALSILTLVGCGSQDPDAVDLIDKQLNQIMAAKTRFALSKSAAPLLNTHNWDDVLGGEEGKELKYDRFGEIDELVFVALPDTFFNVQRQIRKETRAGVDTIYYKVTTPDYLGSETLWIDGRFLDLRDMNPKKLREPSSAAKTLLTLRRYEGLPYTWHGSSSEGVSELLKYYPPEIDLSLRMRNDWTLKGFDSLGMLYQASNGSTPIDVKSVARFGAPVFVDLNGLQADEGNDDPNTLRKQQTTLLMAAIKPLDIIQMGERVWIVLDRGEVIESKYRSKFDGEVQISSLLDTVFGLLQKGVLVKNPFEELEDSQTKKFFIRRYTNTSSLFLDQLTEGSEEEAGSEEPEETESDTGGEAAEGNVEDTNPTDTDPTADDSEVSEESLEA